MHLWSMQDTALLFRFAGHCARRQTDKVFVLAHMAVHASSSYTVTTAHAQKHCTVHAIVHAVHGVPWVGVPRSVSHMVVENTRLCI